MNPNLPRHTHRVDVCVLGGGIAGLLAAVSSARRGASTLLIHDRAVLGGNASSEVRMWICGAHGPNNKETGILEEIQLANLHRNPDGIYSIWDSVLYEFACMTPGLTTLLNCTCNNARMEDGHLVSVDAWQLTTQSWHRVEAAVFIDCSGDSILAPLSGADVMQGRESREAFGEPIAPYTSDLKTMGNTLLIQLEETDAPQSFRAPDWAYHFDDESTLPSRLGNGFGHNFWWLELGGLHNTIDDAETIRDELLKTCWGVWDYMKNRGPHTSKLQNWRLRWLGSLPGKRENRRYVGEHILTQHDLEAEGRFEDIVAYGGWSMDDHHPAGLYYPGKPTIFHKAPSPYGIPLRALYSHNIPNLFCAGRNISTTHAALSSTRVMGTCAIIGQAVGTAAALCHARSLLPRELRGHHLKTLQHQLMDDDCWLPWMSRPVHPVTREATLTDPSGTCPTTLLSGEERNLNKTRQCWEATPGSNITLTWTSPRDIECLRLVFDSDLNDHKRLPCRYPLGQAKARMPSALIKAYHIEIQTDDGHWETLYRESENRRRLAIIPVRRSIRALRWTGESTWGDPLLKVFSIEATPEPLPLTQSPPKGRNWRDIIADLNPGDLAEPDHGLEAHGSFNVGA